MLNLSRVVNNPRFTQSITVNRQTGSYVSGRWTPGTPTVITLQAVVTVPSENDLNMIPEGDRNSGSITVHSALALYQTNTSGTSDVIVWNGEDYRVMKVWPLAQYGYYKAVAVRMSAT